MKRGKNSQLTAAMLTLLFAVTGCGRLIQSTGIATSAQSESANGGTACRFAGQLNAGADVRVIAETADSIFVGGVISSYAGTSVQNLIKLKKSNCQLDTTFTQSSGFSISGSGGAVNALAISGDALFVGGGFQTYRSMPAESLAKLNVNTGELDTTFTQSSGTNGMVYALVASSDALYVGGTFTQYRGVTNQILMKLSPTSGDVDGTSWQFSGFNNTVYALALSGNSLFAGGLFTSHRGNSVARLVKLHTSNGAIDPTFHATSTGLDSYVQALAVSGGALYIGGNFSTYRSATAQKLAKIDLNSGDLDSTFTQSTGANNEVHALATSGDSLWVGGAFSQYRGAAAEGLAKVNLTSGNLDTSVTQSTGFQPVGNPVKALLISGSSLLVGGGFSSYRGSSAQSLIELELSSGAP